MTPTSYLELILTFKTLLERERTEIQTLKTRYSVGLSKLDFAQSQVCVMQQELQSQQPELIKSQLATEQLMVKIQINTVEVENQQEVNKHCNQATVLSVMNSSVNRYLKLTLKIIFLIM